jgi:hypothetical protein
VLSSGGSIVGPSQGELFDVAREAELLVNVSGNLRLASLRDRPRRRVYVDVDPAYTQLWHAAGLDAGLGGHDAYLTVGTAVGTDRCPLPTAGLRWLPVLPPVLLDAWPAAPAPPAPPRYTTVTSWRGSYGRVAHAGRLLGQKAHELRRLADLPVRVPEVALELALSIDASDEADAGALRKHGWAVVEAATVAGDPFAFRDYVSGSWGEFSVAQGAYVSTRSGWFSDRSAHYLASGRPVVLQDTGYPAVLPTGEGLLSYVTPADAAAALRCAHADPTAHREAARAIAREHLDAERVIARALERLGVRA